MIIVKRLADAFIYIFYNYFVSYIPIWNLRKAFYLIGGMKIGKGSRIYMKCSVRSPWKIEIGDNTVINENCYLDGRGGISIGNSTSISLYTVILSASHDSKADDFKYIKEKVVIKNNVWTGVRSTILQGTILENGCILAANSSLKGETESGYIYSGVPAVKKKKRDLKGCYEISHYDFFR